MTITPAIRTKAEIEGIVYSPSFSGGRIRRRNAINKMIEWSNEIVSSKIDEIRSEVNRMKKLNGAKEQDVRHLYAMATALELQLI